MGQKPEKYREVTCRDILSYRKTQGLTLAQMGRLMGLSMGYLSAVERGVCKVTYRVAEAFRKLLRHADPDIPSTEEATKAADSAELVEELGQLARAAPKDYENPPFASAKGIGDQGRAILDAAKVQKSGHLELAGGKLAVWSPVEATGWLYVVLGDTEALLQASGK